MSRRVAIALSIPPLAFLGLFFVWPVASILVIGLAPDGWLDIAAIADAWGRPWLLDTIVFTVALATAITGFSLLVGLPAAWVFARFTFPGRRVLRPSRTMRCPARRCRLRHRTLRRRQPHRRRRSQRRWRSS